MKVIFVMDQKSALARMPELLSDAVQIKHRWLLEENK